MSEATQPQQPDAPKPPAVPPATEAKTAEKPPAVKPTWKFVDYQIKSVAVMELELPVGTRLLDVVQSRDDSSGKLLAFEPIAEPGKTLPTEKHQLMVIAHNRTIDVNPERLQLIGTFTMYDNTAVYGVFRVRSEKK